MLPIVRLLDTTVFAVFGDHGRIDTDPGKWIKLRSVGPAAASAGVRRPDDVMGTTEGKLRIGVQNDVGQFGRLPNVIFVPQFAMANIYVAANTTALNAPPDWTRPPSVVNLHPIVDRLVRFYMSGAKPVSKILVRVPGIGESFSGSRYKVVPAGYVLNQYSCGSNYNQSCLVEQLAEPSTLEKETLNGAAGWPFTSAAKRLEASISINSGDIVLLANVVDGFQFGDGLRAQHGTLTSRDSLVPVAFGFPRATGPNDTTMEPLLRFLSGAGTLTDPTETSALLRLLIR